MVTNGQNSPTSISTYGMSPKCYKIPAWNNIQSQKLIIHNNQKVQYHSSREQSLEYNIYNHKYILQNWQLIHRKSALKSFYSKPVLEMEHKSGNLQVITEIINMQSNGPLLDINKNIHRYLHQQHSNILNDKNTAMSKGLFNLLLERKHKCVYTV